MNIKNLVTNLKALLKSSDSNLYSLAEAFTFAYDNVRWFDTGYKTFIRFINSEFIMNSTDILSLMASYRSVKQFNFDTVGIDTCIKELGWKRFHMAATYEPSKKMPVDEFIVKYKGMALYKLKAAQYDNPQGDRAYGFSLPKAEADKLDGILIRFGMTTETTRRRGVRDSVIQWLSTL